MAALSTSLGRLRGHQARVPRSGNLLRARRQHTSAAGRLYRSLVSQCRAASSARGHTEAPSCSSTVQLGPHSASRRALLAGLALVPLASAAAAVAAEPSSDIIVGTQRWAGLGMQALQVQVQQVAAGEPGDAPLDDELKERRRRLGNITVPGLSSFSFVHGLLVGCAVIAFLAADRLGLGGNNPSSSSDSGSNLNTARPATPSGLDPDVEAALRVAIKDASPAFHDPQVHAAIEEVRADIGAINKYREDPAVMGAFQKLLEIEGILERL